jgi:hypothetical protein
VLRVNTFCRCRSNESTRAVICTECSPNHRHVSYSEFKRRSLIKRSILCMCNKVKGKVRLEPDDVCSDTTNIRSNLLQSRLVVLNSNKRRVSIIVSAVRLSSFVYESAEVVKVKVYIPVNTWKVTRLSAVPWK